MDGINLYKKGKKNLILDTDDKNKNILKEGNNRGIISNEIIDNEKTIDKKKLINKKQKS